MDLVPSEDEVEIVASVERFLAQELSVPQLRERMHTGESVSQKVWNAVANLGVFSLGLKESSRRFLFSVPSLGRDLPGRLV